ncbi:MAG: single-stranded DNA-binding protein [Myxococcales bacterium]|nr:single-stranded DNA-binding protein [Myxococcales bacterium]
MTEGMNKVILIGNLGMDPELKYTQSGQAVLRIRMATTETWGSGGERKERTEWHTVIVWGRRGEALNNILSKGRTIGVEGRIQYRQWDDKDGNKRNSTEIVATNILLLGGGRRDGGGGGGGSYDDGGSYGGGGGSGRRPQGGGSQPPSGDDFPADDFQDDDIPF